MPTDTRAAGGCHACETLSAIDSAPRFERIHWDGTWRIAHALGGALPGWLVVIPARHVLSLADLTATEEVALGPLLVTASRALASVTGCAKTYIASFAEKERFQHLHIHLIPRAADLDPALRGTAVFGYLGVPPSEQVPTEERDRLALAIRDAMKV